MKKILINGLIIGLGIVVLSFIPDSWAIVASFFLPPRVYIIIGIGILLVLWKILIELRNKRDDDK